MKSGIGILLVLAAVSASTASFATSSDDAKWIRQCVQDNKSEGAPPDVIRKYCACMTDKMSEKETRSVTQWEKTHRRERDACSKQAGWK